MLKTAKENKNKKHQNQIRTTHSSQSRLNDFGSVCLFAETIKIGTITISNDDDVDDTVLRWFNIILLYWYRTHIHACMHTRAKPIKNQGTHSNQEFITFCLLCFCFTSHCDLCSGFFFVWALFYVFQHIEINITITSTIWIDTHTHTPIAPIRCCLSFDRSKCTNIEILECVISVDCLFALPSGRERERVRETTEGACNNYAHKMNRRPLGYAAIKIKNPNFIFSYFFFAFFLESS